MLFGTAGIAGISGISGYAAEQARMRSMYEQAIRFQQQQWQRGFAQANPFTQEPVRLSAVAAEAHSGVVIEGSARHVATSLRLSSLDRRFRPGGYPEGTGA